MARRALGPLKKYTVKVVLGPMLKLFEVVTELLIPVLTKKIIDQFIPSSDMKNTLIFGAIILGLGFLAFIVTMCAQYLAARVSADYGYDLKKEIFHKMSTLSEKQLNDYGKQKALTLVNNDAFSLQNGVMMFMRLIFRPPFLIVGALVMSFTIHLYAGLIFGGVVLASGIVVGLVMALSPKRYAAIQSNLDEINLLASDSLKGARPVRAFNKQEDEEAEFGASVETYKKKSMVMSSINALINPLTFCAINLGMILIVYLGNISVGGESLLTTGEIVSLISYSTSSLAALIMFSRLSVSLNKASASMKRVDAFLAMEPSITNNPTGEASDNGTYVKFNNVSFAYGEGNGKNTLNNINISIEKGQWIGFIGGTGSGKSTVISLLERLYEPKEGEILYRGINLNNYDLNLLRDEISLISQKPSIFKGTIRSNVTLGKPEASDGEIEWALKQSLAYEYVSKYPEYIDHEVEEGGANLSGGQKQRLLIARAILKGGSLLILDDSTSALDFLSDLNVRNNISKIDGLTKIIVSQRAGSLKDCDQIYVFDKGEIVACGKHDELVDTCSIYKEIYDMQRAK
ncbi:MAG: ABC transporter ATP-binding protein/permease [Bacilli bacterium]|nr:ABC transporter ATP-binding protein/permease [Bacilli bacterium]